LHYLVANLYVVLLYMFSRKSHKYGSPGKFISDVKKHQTVDEILQNIETEDIKGSVLKNIDVSGLSKEQRKAVYKLSAIKDLLKSAPRHTRRATSKRIIEKNKKLDEDADKLVKSLLSEDQLMKNYENRIALLGAPSAPKRSPSKKGGHNKTKRSNKRHLINHSN